MVEPTPTALVTTRAKPSALYPAQAVVPGVVGEEVGRMDAAVTRSQKRKRDEEEALVVRIS